MWKIFREINYFLTALYLLYRGDFTKFLLRARATNVVVTPLFSFFGLVLLLTSRKNKIDVRLTRYS